MKGFLYPLSLSEGLISFESDIQTTSWLALLPSLGRLLLEGGFTLLENGR